MNDEGDAQSAQNEAWNFAIVDRGRQQADADADIAKVLHSLNSFASF